jgi:hypothetical protein
MSAQNKNLTSSYSSPNDKLQLVIMKTWQLGVKFPFSMRKVRIESMTSVQGQDIVTAINTNKAICRL